MILVICVRNTKRVGLIVYIMTPVLLCTSVSKSNTGETTVRRGARKGKEGVIYGIILMDSFAGSAVSE
jgi:hypothetical protein